MRLTPKSHILIEPFPLRRRFSGFMSPWMIFWIHCTTYVSWFWNSYKQDLTSSAKPFETNSSSKSKLVYGGCYYKQWRKHRLKYEDLTWPWRYKRPATTSRKYLLATDSPMPPGGPLPSKIRLPSAYSSTWEHNIRWHSQIPVHDTIIYWSFRSSCENCTHIDPVRNSKSRTFCSNRAYEITATFTKVIITYPDTFYRSADHQWPHKVSQCWDDPTASLWTPVPTIANTGSAFRMKIDDNLGFVLDVSNASVHQLLRIYIYIYIYLQASLIDDFAVIK